MSKDMRFIKE